MTQTIYIANAGRQLWRLEQDNDPKHKSRLAQRFLSSEVAEVIDWPSNSPDPNPVENLCRVEKRKATNLEELNKFLHEKWVNIDVVVS